MASRRVMRLLIAVGLLAAACGSFSNPESILPGSIGAKLGQVVTMTVEAQEAESPSPPGVKKDNPADLGRFEHLTPEQGGPPGSIYWLTQDHLGFLWIGTSEGLYRYDGHAIKTYKHDPDDPGSLSEDHVFNVLEDRQGTLWVGTYGGGLERLDRDRGQFVHYQFDPGDPDSLSSNKVFALFEDREGTLWVGTSGGGLNRYDPEIDGFVHYHHNADDPYSLPGDYVNSIYEDRSGTLWIGTTDGLGKLDRAAENEPVHFTRYRHEAGDPHSLSSNQVFSIIEDQGGTLWVGTSGGGLNRLDGEGTDGKARFTHFRHNPDDPSSLSDDVVFVLYEDKDGTLWAASLGGGLHQFDREKEQFIRFQHDSENPSSLSNDYVNTVFQDQEGTLWIGTTHALDKYIHQGKSIDRFLAYDHVQSILEDQAGRLWIGTVEGLYQLDENLEEVAAYQHEPDNPHSLSNGWVNTVYQDKDGSIWVGISGKGLDRLDQETGRFDHYRHNGNDPHSLSNDTVNTIYQDRDGLFWIGTDGGLNQFDPRTETFSLVATDPDAPDAAIVESINIILEDNQGTLWVSSWGDGLRRFDPETGQFTVYRHDSNDAYSLRTNFIMDLYKDSAGNLWVGTDGGLQRFEPQGKKFHYYDRQEGLLTDEVYSIIEGSEGNLWLGTASGLTGFDPNTAIFTSYDIEEELYGGDRFSPAFKRSNGQVLLASVSGIATFSPDQAHSNPYVPPVRLTSLLQNGHEMDLAQAPETITKTTISWPQRDFEFQFSSLSYAQPDRNQHAYMLEGYDQEWNYIGTSHMGRYTSLPGGTYTLRLKGSNNTDLWNREGSAIQLTIVPPFWATWWFRGIAILLLVGAVFGGYRLRVRSIESRSRELAQQVRERTIELSRTNELLAQEIAERQRAEEALAQQAADAAVLAERSRLARDLHDAVTQTLFSASLIAEALPELWENDRKEGRQLLWELRQLNRGALAEMRTLLLELRPAALADATMEDLVRQLVESAAGRTGTPVTMSVEGECPLPAEVHIALYRIAQEALNNVVKHAGASRVEVSLDFVTSPADIDRKPCPRVELRVSDDGCGFDPYNIPPNRMGLGILHERAQAIGATLQIKSQTGRGTEIVVIWEGEK